MNSTHHHAYAKINLGLNVLGKRPDGYHDIESIFIEVDLYDDVMVSAASGLEVRCTPAVTADPSDNFVYKAAVQLQAALGLQYRGAKIAVTKRIPTGGGLGGGSSNAGAVLMALYELWTNQPSNSDEARKILNPIASQVGSDVPFFLYGGVGYVTGRGELVEPLTVELPWCVLLVLPDIHIATTTAYSTLGITEDRQPIGLDRQLMQVLENQGTLNSTFKNDFESSVFKQHPDLSTISSTLLEHGAVYASMSGSGSVMYGLFTSVENAELARSAFADRVTYICRPVQRT